MYMLMRDVEGRKKEASKVIQKQHSTPKAVIFYSKGKMSCLGWDLNPHMYAYTFLQNSLLMCEWYICPVFDLCYYCLLVC